MYVAEYLRIDGTIEFEQRHTLIVDGQLIGRVANLAICQEFNSDEVLVEYCDEEWESIGTTGGYPSIEAAKASIERSYRGSMYKWERAASSLDEVRGVFDEEMRAASCSFCGRTPLQIQSMVQTSRGTGSRICNFCIEEIRASLHSEGEAI